MASPGKGAKRKGSRFEQHVAEVLRDWSGDNTFQRAFLSRSQGKVIGDIVTPDWFPFWISCKCQERWSLQQCFANGLWGAPIKGWAAEREVKMSLMHWLIVFSKNYAPDYVFWSQCVTNGRNQVKLDTGIYTPVIPRKVMEFNCGDVSFFIGHLKDFLKENRETWKSEK